MRRLCAFALLVAAGHAAAADLKEVRLGYFANITHAQAVLGVDSGDYARAVAPVPLKTQVFNAGPSLIEALQAGGIDVGYVGPSPAVNGFVRSQGQGLRVISGAAANGVAIVARRSAGIKTLADLKGKRLATPQLGNTQDVAARHYLKTIGAPLDAILPMPNADQAGMMARGQIDAAWAPEPWGARLLADADNALVAEEKSLWPRKSFSTVVVVTTPEFLAAHGDVVRKLLDAHRAWTKKLAKDGTKQAQPLAAAMAKLTGKEIPASVVADGLSRVRFTDDPLEASIAEMARWAFELGFLPEAPSLAGMIEKR